jgi:hypothetical protein
MLQQVSKAVRHSFLYRATLMYERWALNDVDGVQNCFDVGVSVF